MTKFTRRSFVKTATAASGAFMAAPAIGRAGTSANDKMGGCVVGVNSRGNSHIQGWLNDSRSEIRAIVDVDEAVGNKRCDQIAEKQDARPKLYTDMRKAFDSGDVDFISTATPNHWHALAGIWAMQRGKDAYIEKPVCHNVHEGTALIAAARRYEKMCQVGTQCRSSKACNDAIKFLHEGGIGECNFARGLCHKRRAAIGPLGDYPIPANVDFDLWSGPAQYTDPKLTRGRFHYDWHWQRNYGNGDLGNQGPHQTDVARWGLGIDTHPGTILTYGGRLGYQAEKKDSNYIDAGDTGNTEVSIYDYGDKCIVFETRGLGIKEDEDDKVSQLVQSFKGNKIGVIFYGSDGYLVQKSYAHCIAYDKDLNIIKEFKGGDNHFGNFLDACHSRKIEDLNADVREGHLSAAVSHLGNISYYMGENNKVSVEQLSDALKEIKSLDNNQHTLDRTVAHLVKNEVDLAKYPLSLGPLLKFDPKTELFTNNSEANQYLTREYREPYVCPTADKV